MGWNSGRKEQEKDMRADPAHKGGDGQESNTCRENGKVWYYNSGLWGVGEGGGDRLIQGQEERV